MFFIMAFVEEMEDKRAPVANTLAAFVNRKHISESDFSVTAKDRLYQLM
jgi:hypothetical protein